MRQTFLRKRTLLSRARFAVLAGVAAVVAACSHVSTGPVGMRPVREFNIAEYRGKVVVLGFWGAWCSHCESYVTWLEDLHRRAPADKMIVVGISVDEDQSRAQTFADRHRVKTPSYHDEPPYTAKRYKVYSIPQTIVLGTDGAEMLRFSGDVSPNDAQERIARVLALVR